MRKWRERDRARRAAQTASERQATSQQRSTREHERMAAETPEERERLLLSLSSGVSAATLSVLSQVLLCCNPH